MTDLEPLRAAGLRVEQCESPLGVEARQPRLGWRVECARRGAAQSACRVRVGRRPDSADLWDSGWIETGEAGIDYAGAPLQSRQRCYWTVTVRDEEGCQGPASDAAMWEMGLLDATDWHASWLAIEDEVGAGDRAAGLQWIWGDAADDARVRYFRRVVDLAADCTLDLIAGARDRLIRVSLDGVALPIPDWTETPFGQRPLFAFQTVAVPAGAHILGIEVEAGSPGFRAPPGSGFCALLRLTGEHGVRRLPSDASWHTRSGATPWVPATLVEHGHQPWPPRPAMLFRKCFDLSRRPAAARLYLAAMGAAAARINGRPAEDAMLQNEPTDFRTRVLYRAIDVTGLLSSGENCLAVHAGDGWYGSYIAPIGRFGFGDAPPRFLAQLEIDHGDGRIERICSDESWHAAPSPVLVSEIYDGETHDARREPRGWDAPGFDPAGWCAARRAPVPDVQLAAQIVPPIRITGRRRAETIWRQGPARFLFDFGQNLAGICRLELQAPAGTRITLRHGEILDADGRLDQRNLRSARATDTYVCKGDPQGESWIPAFTYHGFRYVELEGLEEAGPATLEAQILGSDLPLTASFACDVPLLDRLWQNTVWTQRANFMGIPSDDPQRDERLGWLGDAAIFADAAAYIMDIAAFSRSFMDGVRDAQSLAGAFPVAIPWGGPLRSDSPTPGWSDGGVFLPWLCWQRYGDTAIVEENWQAIARYLALVASDNPGHLWLHQRGFDFGDWLAFDARSPGDPTTPKDLVATAIWARALACAAEMAEAIGRAGEAVEYRARHAQVGSAFIAAFAAEDGLIGNDSQAGYVLALAAGILPPALRERAERRLCANVEARGTMLTTGLQGTPHALDMLVTAGRADLAVALLLRTECPSWGYMIARGATTIWERWDSDTGDAAVQAHMNSYNQITLGAVSGFLMRRIAGIDAAEPGFKTIRIAPLRDPRIGRCQAEYDSARGRIAVRWERSGGLYRLDATIPPNSRALIHLPAGRLTEAGRPIETLPGLELRDAPDGCVVEAGAGSYQFEVD